VFRNKWSAFGIVLLAVITAAVIWLVITRPAASGTGLSCDGMTAKAPAHWAVTDSGCNVLMTDGSITVAIQATDDFRPDEPGPGPCCTPSFNYRGTEIDWDNTNRGYIVPLCRDNTRGAFLTVRYTALNAPVDIAGAFATESTTIQQILSSVTGSC
jgi:hypothetical protein